jgi:hypothetical protein
MKLQDYIAEFIQNWLEDSITSELYEEVEKTGNQYKDKEKFTTTVINCFIGYFDNRINAFQEQLNKI